MSTKLIDARSHEVESVHMPIEATHPDRFTGRTAGLTALASVGLCIAGAMTQQLSGANLYAAVVYNSLDEADLDQWGVVVQGGFFLVPRLGTHEDAGEASWASTSSRSGRPPSRPRLLRMFLLLPPLQMMIQSLVAPFL